MQWQPKSFCARAAKPQVCKALHVTADKQVVLFDTTGLCVLSIMWKYEARFYINSMSKSKVTCCAACACKCLHFLAWDVSTSQTRHVVWYESKVLMELSGVGDRWRGGEKPAPAKLASCLIVSEHNFTGGTTKTVMANGAWLCESRTWVFIHWWSFSTFLSVLESVSMCRATCYAGTFRSMSTLV